MNIFIYKVICVYKFAKDFSILKRFQRSTHAYAHAPSCEHVTSGVCTVNTIYFFQITYDYTVDLKMLQGLNADTAKERYQRIGEVKQHTPIEKLCEGQPSAFATYLRYARSMDFYEQPEYDYLRTLFTDLMKANSYELDYIFDWMKTPQAAKGSPNSAVESLQQSSAGGTDGKQSATPMTPNTMQYNSTQGQGQGQFQRQDQAVSVKLTHDHGGHPLSARRSSDGARRRSKEERDRGGKGGAKGSKDGDLATSQPEAASSKMNVQQSAGGATPLDVVTNAGEETATALGKDNRRPQVPIVEPDEGTMSCFCCGKRKTKK